jgi:hypothetical protein
MQLKLKIKINDDLKAVSDFPHNGIFCAEQHPLRHKAAAAAIDHAYLLV